MGATKTEEGMTRKELRAWIDNNLCGCGDPEGALAFLVSILEPLRGYPDHTLDWAANEKLMPNRNHRDLTYYWLTRLDILEHGGCIPGWLTGKGARFLDGLKRESGDGFSALMEMHCVHGLDVTDDCEECRGAQPKTKR